MEIDSDGKPSVHSLRGQVGADGLLEYGDYVMQGSEEEGPAVSSSWPAKIPTPSDYAGEVGDLAPIQAPEVEFSLYPSRETAVAGELWSIAGVLHNRSSGPIWIVDTQTQLTLAPEMFGLTSAGSIPAFLPTVRSRSTDEVVRIDPGGRYGVVWKIDPCGIGEDTDLSLWQRVWTTFRRFAFFNPGSFRVFADAHIWTKPPIFSLQGRVTNVGDSYVVTVARAIAMDSSPWVLIAGAAAGGVLAFILQAVVGLASFGDSFGSITRNVAVGLTSAVILSGVVTVLISRLATTDFLVVVKVKDIWGAVATGFAVQWFGYSVLARLLTTVHTNP